MNKTIKIILWVVVAVVVVGGIWYGVSRKPKEEGVIKIGVILPLTGQKAANFGQDIKVALEMAKEEITQKKIELIYQDDECDSNKAVSAYQFLREVHKVRIIIGSVCSSATLAITPLAERDKVILITPASSAETISEAGDFIFRNHTSDKAEIEKLAPHAASMYKKVAIIYDQTNDGTLLNRKNFTEMFTGLGGEIVVDIPVIGGSSNYRTELLKVKSRLGEIDAIFMPVLTKDAVLLVKQASEIGINRPILGNKTFATSDFVGNVGELANRIVYAEAEYTKETDPIFWDKYLQRTGKIPPIWAPQGYDTLKILVMILERCSPDNTICIKDELYKVKDYPGVAGNVSFDQNGDAIKKIILKTIKNGQFVPYEE